MRNGWVPFVFKEVRIHDFSVFNDVLGTRLLQ